MLLVLPVLKMSSVARASAFLRHMPAVYRQFSKASSQCPSNTYFAVAGSANSTKFRHLTVTCPPSRCIQSHGSTSPATEMPSRVAHSSNRRPQFPRKPRGYYRTPLKQLDDMVRRTGRITTQQLLAMFDEVSRSGVATSFQSLLLIRSCGSLLPEMPPKERTELVHSFWDGMKKFGTKYDASHYNALLNVYLQNEHDFQPTDFLAKMEADNVEPNRVTYQRLISAYCMKGDIPGATQILEFMKTKDLPVTEGVFNSLITGHARANDMENARNTLDMMRNVGLEPSADTFTTLMSAYAEKGDMAEVDKVIKEAESLSVFLGPRHFVSVAQSLASSGNEDRIFEILKLIGDDPGSIPDAYNLCLSLLARGLYDAAFETLKLVIDRKPPARLVEGEERNRGNFFLDAAVRNSLPFEKLSSFMDQMTEMGIHSCPHAVVLHALLKKGEAADAENIIRRMKELGHKLQCHYFWPMLAQASSKDEVERLLGLMIEMGVPVSVDTYTEYILPSMKTTHTEAVARVQELGGIVDNDLIIAICRHELSEGRLKGIQDVLTQYPGMGEVHRFRASLNRAFIRSKEVEPFVQILKQLRDRFTPMGDISLPDYIGILVYEMVADIPSDSLPAMKNTLQLLFTRMAEEGIYVSGPRFRGIRNILSRHRNLGLQRSALQIVDPAELEEKSPENVDLFVRQDLDTADLEKMIKELKDQGANYRKPLCNLILLHCTNDDYDKAMELKREFDTVGYKVMGEAYARMISMCLRQDKVSEALILYRQLQEQQPEFVLGIANYAALMTSLGKSNQKQEIFALLDTISDLGFDRDMLERQMIFLLKNVGSEGHPETVQSIFDYLIEKEIVNASPDLVRELVSSYLQADDVTGAFQCIMDCQSKYQVMPYFHDLLVKLVEKGDTEQLQKAMDFASEQHGNLNMLYDLIFAFLTTGKLHEAKKIMETPGMVARNKRLHWYGNKCIDNDNLEALKNLVDITRDLYGCDRDDMYFSLIRYYTKADDPDQCLQVWTDMQEEEVLPKDRTLRYLAKVLTSFGRSVPFQVPEVSNSREEFTGMSSPSSERAPVHRGEHPVIVLSRLGKLEEAERQLEHCREEGQEVPWGVYNHLMWDHLKKGNIEECLQYKERCLKFDEFKPKRALYNKLLMAYTNKGDLENAYKVFCESLTARAPPLRSGMRVLAKAYLEDKSLEKLLELKELYESSTKMSFPALHIITSAYIERNDISGGLAFIEEQLDKHPGEHKAGLRSFYNKLVQRDEINDQVVDFAEQQLAKDVDVPMVALLFAYLDNDKVEEAKALVERFPALQEKSGNVLSYLIQMMGRDDRVSQRIENVLSMTEGQTYLDRGKVYFYLLKACDLSNDWSEGLRVKERMEAEGIQLNELNLKRLGLLLERNGQEVPFTMPPESLKFYREQLQSEAEDQLPEIVAD